MSDAAGPDRQFAEEMALAFEPFGLPRGSGRLLGWLLICDPARQSTADLVASLGISKASVSTAVRLLESLRLVTRIAVPGDRSDYYELLPDAFESAHSHLGTFRVFGDLMAKGLATIGDSHGPRAARLRETVAFYRFLEREWPAMVQRFQREYGEGEQDG